MAPTGGTRREAVVEAHNHPAEVDLVLELGAGEVWAVEIKRGPVPKVSRGFRAACEDVMPDRKLVVHGGDESYPLRDGVEAASLAGICGELGS
ncbi:MAG: hypothetical protein OXU64_05620 [Gemmatimonadota bacterium]|nr:hypothetical protein [Gemmatimonadota bacterium]